MELVGMAFANTQARIEPNSIAACGRAGSLATRRYKSHGFNLYLQGAHWQHYRTWDTDGWRLALEQSQQNFSLVELLAPAVALAKMGSP